MLKYLIGLAGVLASVAAGAVTPAQQPTIFEVANVHMALEAATNALTVIGRGIGHLQTEPTDFGPRNGQNVFSFDGSYSDDEWSLDGHGLLYGKPFTLQYSGNRIGNYGEDFLMEADGLADIEGNTIRFSTTATWKFNPTLQAYDKFDVDQEAKVEEGVWVRIWSWIVRTAEEIVTIVVTEVVRIAVTGATAPELGPLAYVPGAAAAEVTSTVMTKVTKSISNGILREGDDSEEPEYPSSPDYPEGPDGDGPGRRPIATLVDPRVEISGQGLAMVNNPSLWLLAEARFANGQFSGAFAAVPEPATWLMLISGFGGTGIALRRRRAIPAEGL